VLLISGCASEPVVLQARIAPNLAFTLPALSESLKQVEAAQIVSGNAGATPIQFESQIRAGNGEIVVVMVDPLGRRGLEIHWDRHGVTSKVAEWLPKEVQPFNILADIVIAHWPASEVRNGLVGARAVLRETADARVISGADGEVMRIDYEPGFAPPWNGSLVVRNFALGYTLRVMSALTRP